MDDVTFERARQMDRAAVEAMLAEFYPLVWRVTLALTGRADVGTGVVRYVMRRSLKSLPRWQHAGDPMRWFTHYTIISTRRAGRHAARLEGDPLRGPQPQAKYMAFVTALRDLQPQQREALILHDCEGLDLRQTAVAMDCSTEAAGNHLQAARQQLGLIAGPDYERLAAALKRTYQGLTPGDALLLPAIRKHAGRFLWPRRVKKALKVVVLIAVLVALYWAASKVGLVPERYRIA